MPTPSAELRLVTLESVEWLDTDSQLRIDRSQEHVDNLATVLADADDRAREAAAQQGGPVRFEHPFPPIVLFTDGGINGRMFIGDGYNRFHAHRKAARDAIRAEVHVVADPRFGAFRYALGANATHGLPRTNADKRNAVRHALACPQFAGYSLRQLAELCALSHMTVKRIKDEDEAARTGVPKPAARAAKSAAARSLVAATLDEALEDFAADAPDDSLPAAETNERPLGSEQTSPGRKAADPNGSESGGAEAVPRDRLKRPVPPALVPQWRGSRMLESLKKEINAVLARIEEVVTADGMAPGFEHFNVQGVFLSLKSATDELTNAAYHTDCPDCAAGGDADGRQDGKKRTRKCRTCLNTGYLTPSMYERLPPKSKEKLNG